MKSNRSKLLKVLTQNEVDKALACNFKFSPRTEKYLTVREGSLVSIKRFKSDKGVARMLWECSCGEFVSTQLAKVPENLSCGCEVRALDRMVRWVFSNKISTYYTGAEYCRYCGSYRDKLIMRNSGQYVCGNCDYIISNGMKVGATFEDLMQNWNPEEPDLPDAKRLPYFSGNVNKGFVIEGYTLIDSSWYETCSKIMWTRGTGYIKCSLSKENMFRIGKVYRKGIVKYMLLHRFVCGLGNSVDTLVVDHISGDKLDNRLCNLRLATIIDNARNCRKSIDNTAGYIGVFYDANTDKKIKRYRAKVERCGKSRSKFFHTLEEAARGYDELLRELYPSEFNRYNFPLDGETGVDG